VPYITVQELVCDELYRQDRKENRSCQIAVQAEEVGGVSVIEMKKQVIDDKRGNVDHQEKFDN